MVIYSWFSDVYLFRLVADDRGIDSVPRLARSIRLCPHGMSGERCFYSQLAMFVRQHNSFTDPVALRNIGKRNVINERPNFDDNKDYFDDDYYRHIAPLPSDTDISSTTLNKDSTKGLVDDSSLYANGNYLATLVKLSAAFKDNKQRDTDYRPQVERDRSQFHPVSKRQIICPRGMPRITCYDDALAFYIQLMRTMNHKRFV